MTAPTVPVTIRIADFGGPAVPGITVTAAMNMVDYTADGVFVGTEHVQGVTDVNGELVMELFPNAVAPAGLGTVGSTVSFKAKLPGSRRLDVRAAIPNAPCDLTDILVAEDIDLTEAQRVLQEIQADMARAEAAAESVEYLYPGSFAVEPTTRPDGSPRQVGDAYFNSASNLGFRWNGATWAASDINTANLAASGGSALVGTLQPGVGAVTSTLANKLHEHVSVFDYIDDTQKGYILARDRANMNAATVRAGIQKCLNAVGTGLLRTRRIYVPGGLYLIDQMLFLYSRVEFFGDGPATEIENVNTTGSSPTRGVFAHGHYASPGVDDIGAECSNNAYAVNAIAAVGNLTFTLTTPADASNFAEGQIVFLHNGVEKQYGAGQAKTRQELECRRVASVNAGTGVVTLDRPLRQAHATCFATISGKAQIKSGLNEPASHYIGTLDRLYIHDIRIKHRNFMGLPGSVYDSVFERVWSDGPYGYSVNFAFSSVVRGCTFLSAVRAIELAMSAENIVENNAVVLDDEYRYDGTAGAVYGMLMTQGSHGNIVRGNRLWASMEYQPVFDGGSGLFGETSDNTIVDNYCVGTSSSIALAYGDVSLVNSTNCRVLRNTFIGGNKFHHTFNAAAGFEVDGNRHLAQVVVPEQAHNFQAAGAGCSGFIRNNEHDGALSFDINPGMAASVLPVYVEGNWYRGTVATKTTYANFSGARYGGQLSWIKASAAFTASDTTEQTIFSHTIAAQAKLFSRYDAEFWAVDTANPTTDKTLRLYDGATLLGTLTLPFAFGRARTLVELEVSSVNDASVRFVLKATQFPYAAPGVAQVLGWVDTVGTTSATAHQPKVTLQAAATSPFSVTGVQLAKAGCAGGSWTA